MALCVCLALTRTIPNFKKKSWECLLRAHFDQVMFNAVGLFELMIKKKKEDTTESLSLSVLLDRLNTTTTKEINKLENGWLREPNKQTTN